MNPYSIWLYGETPAPPMITELIGRKVIRGWILPTGKTLVLRLEGGYLAEFEATPAAAGAAALFIKTGQEKPRTDWAFLERETRQTAHLKRIRGMIFNGLDCLVVRFGESYGARVTLEGIAWVMAASAVRVRWV